MGSHIWQSEQNNTFLDLLTIIGNEIPGEALCRLKVLLRGHVDKDALKSIETGSQLLLILHKRGLVANKRLSFLRKFLKEAKCLTSLGYLDSYDDRYKTWDDEGRLQAAICDENRNRRLDTLTKRIEDEIHVSKNTHEHLKQEIDNLEDEIRKKKQSIIEYEDSVHNLKLSIKSEQSLLQSVRKRLEDLKYVIRKLYREEESLSEKLTNSLKPKRVIRDDLAAKRVEIKGKELLECELFHKYERVTEQIRLLNTNFRHHTSEIIHFEEKIQEDTSKLKNLKKNLYKNVTSTDELKQTLAELQQNSDNDTSTVRSYRQMKGLTLNTIAGASVETSVTKMIDHNSLVEPTEPRSIGRYGTLENPPQFKYPRGVAIDINNELYVADSKNSRVHVISLNGKPVRKPIYLGKNFHPTSLAVSLDRHVFISDSHVVRVYSSNGELLRYILPIYAKSDVHPQITGLATMNDGSLLLVDKANKQIQKFRQDGIFQRFIGGKQVFQSPLGVSVTSNGDIVVIDACQIKILDGRAESVKNIIGTKGIGREKFLNPSGLTVDKEDNIIVADSGSHQIHVFNLKDEEDSLLGGLGTDAGYFDTPCGVAVSSDGSKIVVVEEKNHRLQIFTRLLPAEFDYERYLMQK
ncbi:uncharacterized protein LOC114531021 [Dendronephthya gigantea]|uniref:uncharacterized protein LOC114531021 n=1 Tax=Dendronephthya gigantea TaxID=151771 RepID=UPI00106CB237|nr:uncharacterized protein LOC114531021 [Dendronephthya gigantea]